MVSKVSPGPDCSALFTLGNFSLSFPFLFLSVGYFLLEFFFFLFIPVFVADIFACVFLDISFKSIQRFFFCLFA